jgi:hypothetical protein
MSAGGWADVKNQSFFTSKKYNILLLYSMLSYPLPESYSLPWKRMDGCGIAEGE